MRRDVVIVGSGHNALVAACYLAREGLDVEVVERDTVAGGAVSTVERFPGHRVDRGSSAHIMIRHTGIVEDLELADVGLRYLDLDPWGFHPVPGAPGGGITFRVSLADTCASIEAVCGSRDADAYHRFATLWAARNRAVFEAFQHPPGSAAAARAFWRAGGAGDVPGGGAARAREFLSPGDTALDETFTDEHLRTALSWLGAQAGPPTWDVATADLVGWNMLLHDRAPGRPVGGSGMLSTALIARLESFGGRVRLGDGVAAIRSDGNRVDGVVTESGEHIRAGAVLAGCHVLTTLRLAADALPAGFADRAERSLRIGNGIGMVTRLATTALPTYPGAPDDVHSALQLLVPDRAALRRAYGDHLAGRVPEEPPVVAMGFSRLDPTLAPPGEHNVTVWGQWHPRHLADGRRWDDDLRQHAGDRLVAMVERSAPGFAASVRDAYVQTPLDLERELGLHNGNVMHLEMTLDAMFMLRPLPGLSGYRTPLPGLYLCGASTHPGGGVFGASGRAAAGVLLRDRARRRQRDRVRGVRDAVTGWRRA